MRPRRTCPGCRLVLNRERMSLSAKGQQPVARLVPYEWPKKNRPRVGTRTSRRVTYEADCFAPLTDQELEDWDLR